MGLLNPKPSRPHLPLHNEKVRRTPYNYNTERPHSNASYPDGNDNDDDDGWSTESSFEDTRGSSAEYSATAYMIPKPGQKAARLQQQRRRPHLYRLPNRVIRYLCIAMISGIIIFILALVRASHVENKRIAAGHGKDRLPQAAPLPKAWEAFPFLKRYYGGIRTLVSVEENVPEYPRDEDEVPPEEVNVTARALPESKLFASYPGAEVDDDVVECFVDEEGKVKIPGVRYYEGRPSGFPDHVFGSYEALGLPEDICFERYGKLGPYGLGYSVQNGGTGAGRHGDQEGAEEVWLKDAKVDYSSVDWAEVQRRCYNANSNRFQTIPPRKQVPGFYIGDEKSSKATRTHDQSNTESNTTANAAPEHSDSQGVASVPRGDTPRSALVLRCWDSFPWSEEDVLNLRSLISELSLESGGRYDVHLLVQVRDDAQFPVMADEEAYAKRIRDTVPKEFQGMTTLWTVTQMLSLYQGVRDTWITGPDSPVHGAYRGLQMAMQHFSSVHPEYEYLWHWEMDLRYTGHYLDFLGKTEKWAREQPRKGLWERSGRFYFPSVHGTWEDFRQMVKFQAEMATSDSTQYLLNQPPSTRPPSKKSVWGPVRPADEKDHFETENDPTPPHSAEKDKYSWGVGEEADLITFSPIFDPEGTTWGLSGDITGYNTTGEQGERLPPRRAHVVAASRMSRRLLTTMHRETAYRKHFAFSEMWPATVALHHGFKAVYAPHPVFVNREWPTSYMSGVLNGGASGAVGGSPGSVYGDHEHNLGGVGFFYRAVFGGNLWERWLGLRIGGAGDGGGEGFETTRDDSKTGATVGQMNGGEGRMCLPPMLLHPIRDVELPLEVAHDEVDLLPESDPSA